MDTYQRLELAKDFCIHFHDGQFRKGSNQPYHTHPMAVAQILERFGYSDEVTQCVALLHDVVEDTNAITGEIKDRFGYEIANGVFVLSKNTIGDQTINFLNRSMPIDVNSFATADLYKMRLSFARRKVKRVKIADMIHNTQDLVNLTKPGSIERKIADAEEFYIPMGRDVAPLMVKELEENIRNYKRRVESN